MEQQVEDAQPRRSRAKRNKSGVPMHEFLVRIPESMNEKLEARCAEESTSKVAIVRAALRRYLK